MSVANVSRNRPSGLPKELQVAQNAIDLPEVREMLKKLSQYNLGIYMPHMHDEEGAFQPLPPGITQVEDGLEVSFRPNNECMDDNSYVSVGWFLHPGMTDDDAAKTVCRNRCHTPFDTGIHSKEHVKERPA
jgi:hypothetical protein